MEAVRLDQVGEVAKRVLSLLPASGEQAALVALNGNLGAGKTTFVQALGKELGVTEGIQSPTYVLMKSYSIQYERFTTLVHIDAYRLEKPEEFAALKPEAFLHNQHTLVVLEWPERVEGQLPKPDITINFSSEGAAEGERYIEVL